MEPSGLNRWQPWQMGRARKPLKQADPQPVATHGNRFAAHGKEGVDGSSPSEGSLQKRRMSELFRFCVQVDLQGRHRAVGMEPFMELPRVGKLREGVRQVQRDGAFNRGLLIGFWLRLEGWRVAAVRGAPNPAGGRPR